MCGEYGAWLRLLVCEHVRGRRSSVHTGEEGGGVPGGMVAIHLCVSGSANLPRTPQCPSPPAIIDRRLAACVHAQCGYTHLGLPSISLTLANVILKTHVFSAKVS